jgi:DNA sulfur modification protein DndC
MMNVLGQGNLTGDLLKARGEEIRDVYQNDERPWVVGYSGGKDSTTALQLVWLALSKLPHEALRKPVYIISSDTLVETPKIVEYLHGSLERMNEAAKAQGLPFSAHKVSPELDDTFWVNLLGRGYPAPSKRFRWCTDRMKIQPANRFILDTVAKYGEVVVVLGVRSEESATRAQVMSLHRITGSPLSRHSFLPHAYVYTPIKEFTTADVWAYLLQVPSPWGNDNRSLVTMYRNAQAGECPLVVDKTTPSCGNSRFGCWVCTVVERDKSMEAMVESGEDWLQPLLDFRDELARTHDPSVKAQLRDFKRRDGHVKAKKDGDGIVRGPYRLPVRRRFLKLLLETQERVRREGPNPIEELITPAELHEIRRIWRTEEGDWEDSLPTIYRDATGRDLVWVMDEQPGFSGRDKALLDELCRRRGIPTGMVAKLLDVEREVHGMSRRSTVYQRITSILDEDWRTEEEVLRQYAGSAPSTLQDGVADVEACEEGGQE